MKTKLPVNGNVNPANKKKVENAKQSFKNTKERVSAVVKDTNKTRRKPIKPTTGKIIPVKSCKN